MTDNLRPHHIETTSFDALTEGILWWGVVSLAVHALLLIFSNLQSPQLVQAQPRLTVELTKGRLATEIGSEPTLPVQEIADSRLQETPVSTPVPPEQPQTIRDNSSAQSAQFITPPDFSKFQSIRVPTAGKVTINLRVSRLGTVDDVEVVRADPVPTELLDEILSEIRQTRLTAAVNAQGKRIDSVLNLVIYFEPNDEESVDR